MIKEQKMTNILQPTYCQTQCYKPFRVLNLYAGIGGNRRLWKNVQVTAVELDDKIAEIYKMAFQDDEVIVGDAHEYLLDHIVSLILSGLLRRAKLIAGQIILLTQSQSVAVTLT